MAEFGTRKDHIIATRLAAEEAKTLLVPLDYIFRVGRQIHVSEFNTNGWYYTRDGMHTLPFASELIAKTMLHVWKWGKDIQ